MSKREPGWAAVGNPTGAQAAWEKWLRGDTDMSLQELVLARDYVYMQSNVPERHKIVESINARLRQKFGGR